MNDSSVLVIPLRGELDINRAIEIEETLAIAGPGGPILLDLSEVTYADSTVISALFRCVEQAAVAERRIAVLIVTPQLSRLFEYAGVAEAIPLFRERGPALTYLMR